LVGPSPILKRPHWTDNANSSPLCIEDFDLSDKNFRPCPCGYQVPPLRPRPSPPPFQSTFSANSVQICQFCFNSLKTTYEKSTCPNCRRPYDEKTIQYKIPTAEEFKLDQANKNKKQAAAKRKETEKREVEASSRRNLAGMRVKQENLVYVIGLVPQIKDEQALLQTLRGPEYFGQYGEIDKIVVSKGKPGASNQGIGVYVTYARNEDAALCINSVDGSQNGDRVLRAQFGTTKYCSAFLRYETCTNKGCSFLHDAGEGGQSSSLQNESHGAKVAARSVLPTQLSQIQPPPRPQSTTQSVTSQPMAKQGSGEGESSRKNSQDASALPSTASWAAANASVAARTRRDSRTPSRATPSPQITHAQLATTKPEETKPKEGAPIQSTPVTTAPRPPTKPTTPVPKPKSKTIDSSQDLSNRMRMALSRNYKFVYDDSCLPEDDRALINDMPSFIDPYGGAKRAAMREKEEAEHARLEAEAKARLEAQATSAAEETLDEDNIVAGSLALGGEPEDDPRSSSARGAISRPGQPAADQFSLRSITPQHRQQMGTTVQAAPGLALPRGQNTAFEMSDFDRSGPAQFSQAQYDQLSNHQRHGSRYFNNDKAGANRFQGQQQGFYSSGVQGPPPGLPTAGTPPVSGGGMFAHGQNFTQPSFGNTKDINADVFSRNRSGTNQGHDLAKRELLLSLQNNPLRSPPLSAPAHNPLYAQYQTYQDPGLVKQRKKGKKHRHANTSSSGGGVEHLADPTGASARVHQSNTTGQGLFGGNQGGYQQPSIYGGGSGYNNRWS
jgi:CCR4-NOT transcription complex subunit 4